MFEKLLKILIDPKESVQEAPEGICPVCWGHQQYGDEIRRAYKDKQININNHSENQTFIQEFVTTNLTGIKLKKTELGYECLHCHTKTFSNEG